MLPEQIEGLLDFALAAALDGMAEQHLAAEVVPVCIEVERGAARVGWPRIEAIHAAAHEGTIAENLDAVVHAGTRAATTITTGPRQSPSGEDVRERDDVVLGISAVDAERMEFHQLARVVLVDALELALRTGRARRGILPVIEIEQHRGMTRGGAEQIAKASHRMRPDRFLFERAGPDIAQTLAREDVEVIEPERGQHFLQLARTFDCADEARLDRLANNDARALAQLLLIVLVVAIRAARHLDRALIFDEQRRRCHMQRAEIMHTLDQRRWNLNRFRIQLLMDPGLGADRADMLEVAGSRPEREPVEHMK